MSVSVCPCGRRIARPSICYNCEKEEFCRSCILIDEKGPVCLKCKYEELVDDLVIVTLNLQKWRNNPFASGTPAATRQSHAIAQRAAMEAATST